MMKGHPQSHGHAEFWPVGHVFSGGAISL